MLGSFAQEGRGRRENQGMPEPTPALADNPHPESLTVRNIRCRRNFARNAE